MNRIPRRIFSAEFKREAVHLITKQGLTFAEVSRKLDVATKSLRTWMAQFERGELKASLGASKLTADQLRIRDLERELAIAKMERDILKKATALFAKESRRFKTNLPTKVFWPGSIASSGCVSGTAFVARIRRSSE